MLPVPSSFRFDHDGTEVIYGRGTVGDLGAILAEAGLDRALVVCGTSSGANDDLLDPIRRSLGDRLAGVFAETTPAKVVETVYDGIDAMRHVDADVLVGVGGVSSLDIARQVSVFAAAGRSLDELRADARQGCLEAPNPGDGALPVVVVATTLAGADIATGGRVTVLDESESPTGDRVRTGGHVTPIAAIQDPTLYETTPAGPLKASAMNGFDKPLETVYARGSTPLAHATAVHSLRLYRDALPGLTTDPSALERAVVAGILGQLDSRIALIHAIGQAVARRYPIPQGAVHAVVAPHVLDFLFGRVDANRALLAAGMAVDAPRHAQEEMGIAIVEAVTSVRDGLALPTRLRDLDAVPRSALPDIAAAVRENAHTGRTPAGADPSARDVGDILEAAW